MNEKLLDAIELATRAHQGQKRSDGADYITHPEAVAELVVKMYGKNDKAAIVAWLHDVKEDSRLEFNFAMQFGKEVEEATNLLFRKKDMTYFEYIIRLIKGNNLLALQVKAADLTHNMLTLSEGSMKDKYRFAFKMVMEAIENFPQTFEN